MNSKVIATSQHQLRVETGDMATVFSTLESAAEQIAVLQQEIIRLREDCECYEAMKEGVGVRIADLEAEVERLKSLAYEALTVSPENTDTHYGQAAKKDPVGMLAESYTLLREQSEHQRAAVDRLRKLLPRPEDVDTAIRANNMGGLEFREEYCQCDPDVGCSPCPYCAIDMVLQRLLKAVDQKEEREREK